MDMNGFLVDMYFTENEKSAEYMMGSSDPESLSMNEIMSGMLSYKNASLSYELGNGYLPLREKLAQMYSSIKPENIAVMNGGEESIYVIMRALLRPGDEIVVQMPSYQSLSVIAKEIGCSIIEYRTSFEEDWNFDLIKLQSKITTKTKMLVLNYPHNPTGACLLNEDMEIIAQMCREYDLYLVSDEVYRFLKIDTIYSDGSFADLYDKAIAIGSFSKTFAAPGLRLGWVAVKSPGILSRILTYRHFTSTCSNLPCQYIANEIMKKKDIIIKRNNDIILNNAELLNQFIARYPDIFDYVPPKGATMAYVRLHDGTSAADFCEEVLEKTGVLIVPSSVLDDNYEYLRIGLGRKNFHECLERLNDYLTEKKETAIESGKK